MTVPSASPTGGTVDADAVDPGPRRRAAVEPTIGVMLPTAAIAAGERGAITVADAARHSEQAGFDSVWVGDHLMTGQPILDCLLVLATAAAASERVQVGSGVLLVGLRPLAVLAKQVASMQALSGDRFILGIGSGGPWPDEWAAAGVPYADRGRRTDHALDRLPALVTGEEVVLDELDGAPTVALAPATAMPSVWVGGGSRVARRRAVDHDGVWFPSMVLPDDLRAAAPDLAALAGDRDRAVPPIAVGLFGSLGPDGIDPAHLASGMTATYGLDPARAAQLPLTGGPAAVADRLHAYRAAGADHLVVGLAGPDWRHQVDLLAEARDHLEA